MFFVTLLLSTFPFLCKFLYPVIFQKQANKMYAAIP